MRSLLSELAWPSAWAEFSAYRREKGYWHRKELAELDGFVRSRAYLPVAERILSGLPLPLPEKKLVNKVGKRKKRVVYSFPAPEMWTLKLLAFLLYRYNDKQPDGVYSFRQDGGAHRAVRKLAATPGIAAKWCYKLDVSDYFNSIDIPLLLPALGDVLGDDAELAGFFERLLAADEAVFEGRVVRGPRGVMAGTPTAPFLANIYLRELDGYFTGRGVPYARYADDIILFCDTEAELGDCRAAARGILEKYKLRPNPDKERVSAPGEPWEFLGVAFQRGQIDLSAATKAKIKGKISRKARALRRWMLRRDAGPERAMRAMIQAFNKKFFASPGARAARDLTWARWFFPLVTKSDGFGEVDRYLQQYIRYIPTGRHCKKNWRTSYATLKKLGYRSLVHEYHEFRAARSEPSALRPAPAAEN